MAIGDVQPMWDTSVDAQSNEVIVAVDLDQGLFIISCLLMLSNSTLIGSLCKPLKITTVTPVSPWSGMPSGSSSQITARSPSWWTGPKRLSWTEFYSWNGREHTEASPNTPNRSSESKLRLQFQNLTRTFRMNRRIRKNKRCNTQNFPGVISSDVEAAFEGLYNSMANECLAYDIIRSMNSVLNLYQGQCRNASRWTNRINNLVKKMDRKKRGDLQCWNICKKICNKLCIQDI